MQGDGSSRVACVCFLLLSMIITELEQSWQTRNILQRDLTQTQSPDQRPRLLRISHRFNPTGSCPREPSTLRNTKRKLKTITKTENSGE